MKNREEKGRGLGRAGRSEGWLRRGAPRKDNGPLAHARGYGDDLFPFAFKMSLTLGDRSGNGACPSKLGGTPREIVGRKAED